MRSESEKEEVDRMSQQNIEIDTKPLEEPKETLMKVSGDSQIASRFCDSFL